MTVISFKDDQWRMDVDLFNTTGLTDAPAGSFGLGKHVWNLQGDSRKCHQGQPYSMELKLTGCREGEFTCSDGQCVRMEERCDQLVHCLDKSDEENCKLLMLENSYNKRVPPIATAGNTLVPATVTISITLMKVVAIKEVEHKIDLQFGISLSWNENRAKYYNLKDMSSLNSFSDDEFERLWLPYVIYDNTDMKEAVQLVEGVKTTVVVTRDGDFTRSGLESADEIEIFQGAENMLTMRQTYSKEFQCEYQLYRYPFDKQVCSIDLTVQELDLNTVELIPSIVLMESQIELTTYIIEKWELVYRNTSDVAKGIKLEITFKRRIMNELLTTYLPSVLLIMITYATTFFKPFYFEAALTVNLTSMLVITTLFVAVMDKLPPTAYIKMVDYWLIFGQLIPFIEVCILTMAEHMRDGTSGVQTVNHHGQAREIPVASAKPARHSAHSARQKGDASVGTLFTESDGEVRMSRYKRICPVWRKSILAGFNTVKYL